MKLEFCVWLIHGKDLMLEQTLKMFGIGLMNDIVKVLAGCCTNMKEGNKHEEGIFLCHLCSG